MFLCEEQSAPAEGSKRRINAPGEQAVVFTFVFNH